MCDSLQQRKKMREEIWKEIPGYEGAYQASNLGNIKNLRRFIIRSRGGCQEIKEKILRQHKSKSGYCTVAISVNGKPITKYVHRLVASSFMNTNVRVVDHINGIKYDNRIENLRECSQRDNLTFENVKRSKSKLPHGVTLNSEKYKNRFRARIRIKNKLVDLGSYYTEELAGEAYLKAKLKLNSK